MKYRKLLCVALVLVLLLGLSGSGLALTLDTITTGPIGTVTGIVEEKIYSKATLEDDFADDRVLVVLNNAASLKLKTYTAADFPEISCASVSDLSTATKARVSAKLKGEDVAAVCGAKSDNIVFSDFYEVDVQKYNQILCLTLPTAGKQNVLAAMKLLMQREDVKYAGPDFIYSLSDTTPNDTWYVLQWAPEKIQLPQAWDISTGSSTVFVGVIDSGIDAIHTDLSGRVSIIKSRDCTSGEALSVLSVTDTDGHGTHVAGIIAAKGNNNVGVAGVAWNVQLVSLKVFVNGSAYSSHVAAAINYAELAHIPILNFSGGWLGGIYNDYYVNDGSLEEAIEDYTGLFVCAAGNEYHNNDVYTTYPANFEHDNLLCVTASTSNDTRWYKPADPDNFLSQEQGSNISGENVDLYAPGDSILSTYPNNRYEFFSGTSMATPYVTGVAALLLSECASISVSRMKNVIINSCDIISHFDGECKSGGRLNAYKAMQSSHTQSYCTPNNSTNHTRTYSCCGKVKTESHSFISFGVQFTCKYCAYVTAEP